MESAMKKLMFKCILLLLLVGSVLHVLSEAYRHTNVYWNQRCKDDTTAYLDMPGKTDIAVLGASQAREAFKYPPEESSFFNFAISAQTPQYDAALLRQYQDRIRPGALVVLTLCYISPYWVDEDAVFQGKQARYYQILHPWNIVDVDWAAYFQRRIFPILSLEPDALAEAFFQDPERTALYDEETGHNQLPVPDPAAEPAAQAMHWSMIEPLYPEVNPVMWDAYHEMLDRCREQGWNAVLLTPPYLSDYNAGFPDGFYEMFTSRVNELAAEYGIPFLDYSHDPAYAKRYDLFRDGTGHLNLEGAAKFNEQFFSDVQALGLY